MKSGFLQFNQSRIHYLRSGNGKKLLICFHGYGESARHFNFLTDLLKSDFTILSIDLPFHGETDWVNGPLDEKKLKSIITLIIQQEGLPAARIHLLGFSLGGRLALTLFEQMSADVERLVLLAPDGLKLNFWYWLSTQTTVGNKCFKWTMTSPGWFLGILRLGNRVRLINPSIYKFVEYYIHDEQVRQQLYDRWTTLKKCKPSLTNIRSAITKNNTTARLLYGKHDRIILPSPALRFIEGIDSAKIIMLDCGHQVLHSKNANAIADALIN